MLRNIAREISDWWRTGGESHGVIGQIVFIAVTVGYILFAMIIGGMLDAGVI